MRFIGKKQPTLKVQCVWCNYSWHYKGTMPTADYNVRRSCPRCGKNVTIKVGEMNEN